MEIEGKFQIDEDPNIPEVIETREERYIRGDPPQLNLKKDEQPFDLNRIKLIKKVKKHKGQIIMIIYAKRSNTLISCGTDKRILVFDGNTFSLAAEFKNETNEKKEEKKKDQTIYLHEMKDGNIIAGTQEGLINIWNFNTRQIMASLKFHEGKVSKVSQLSNGNLISCSSDGTIKIFDPLYYNVLFTLKVPSEKLISFEEMEDSSILTFGEFGSKNTLWKYEDGKYFLEKTQALTIIPSPNQHFYDKKKTKNVLAYNNGLKIINTKNWFVYKENVFKKVEIKCFARLNDQYIIAGTDCSSFIIMNNNFAFKYIPTNITIRNPINSIVKIDDKTFVTVSGNANPSRVCSQGSMKIWKFE